METIKNNKLQDFRIRKNKQRPAMCFSYEKNDGQTKHTIFTMNGGETFLATIEEKRSDSRFYEEFNETHDSIENCLTAFDKQEN